MQDADAIQRIETKFPLPSLLYEQMRQQWAAAEASAYGWGGIQAVAHATGISPTTIRKGQAELIGRSVDPDLPVESRVRRAGAGRKRKTGARPGVGTIPGATRGPRDSP